MNTSETEKLLTGVDVWIRAMAALLPEMTVTVVLRGKPGAHVVMGTDNELSEMLHRALEPQPASSTPAPTTRSRKRRA